MDKIYKLINIELEKNLPFKLQWGDREIELLEFRDNYIKIDLGPNPPKNRKSYKTGIWESKISDYRTGELWGLDYDGIWSIINTFLGLISLNSYTTCKEAINIISSFKRLKTASTSKWYVYGKSM